MPMIAPDGTSGEIPVGRVQDAVNAGFKRAVPMTAPDGKSTGYIPEDNAPQAVKAGFKMTNPAENFGGEGVYNMWDDAGHRLPIAYSRVPIAQAEGYKFDTNADAQTGRTPEQQFEKDAAYAQQQAPPNATGDIRPPTDRERFLDPDLYPVGAPGEGVGENLKNLAQRGGVGIFQLADAAMNPGRTVRSLAASVLPDQVNELINKSPDARGREMPTGEPNPVAAAYQAVAPGGWQAVANVAPMAGQALVGGALSEAVPAIASDVREAAGAGAGKVRGLIAGDVNAPIPGTEVSPATRYAAMQRTGVMPNAAEAAASTPLKVAQKYNQNSMTAADTYANARAANLAALNRFTDRTLDQMSPVGPEEGGGLVQQGLKNAQANLQQQATQGFTALDEAMGSRKMSGATIQETAQKIYDANKDYMAAHPELAPGNAWKVVKDLAGEGNTPAFTSRPMSFGEVHQLRSDLLEMVRTNPDIVKNQAGAWLQQLANAADQTITKGATGLSPEGTQTFRDANEAWANMKGTYDNPSHPFYQAVRTPSPSTLVNGISRTPEMAKALSQALGPDGIGPVQRGVAEKLLGSTKEGGYNFKTFQGQWNKLPQSYRDALFTPAQQQAFADIGNAGTVLHEEINPSGTAKLGQGQKEMMEGTGAVGMAATGHPLLLGGTAAYHAAQYALGRLMNSPTFVDWLMRDQGVATPKFAGGAPVPAAPALVAPRGPMLGPQQQQ